MKLKVADMLDRLHVIIDDVKRTDGEDDFSEDKDTELREALLTSAEQLTAEVPENMLQPRNVVASLSSNQDYDAIQTQYTDGHGSLVIPDDFMRLVELRLRSWSQSVRSLMSADSQEAMMQASLWTRGTPQKPRAMLGTDTSGKRVIVYWTAGRYQKPDAEALQSVYNHEVERFTYVPRPCFKTETEKGADGKSISVEYLSAPLTDACEKSVLYRAAGVFMEAKKEATIADRLYQLSKL